MQRYAYTGGDPVNHVDPTGDYGCTLGPDCVGSAAQGTDGSCSYVCNNVTQVNQGQQVTTTQAAQNRRYYSGASSAPAALTPLEAATLATIKAQADAATAAAAQQALQAQEAAQAQSESTSLAATERGPTTYAVPSVPIGPVNNSQGQAWDQLSANAQYCSDNPNAFQCIGPIAGFNVPVEHHYEVASIGVTSVLVGGGLVVVGVATAPVWAGAIVVGTGVAAIGAGGYLIYQGLFGNW